MQNKKKSQKRILIIEDEPLHQKIFQNLLGKLYDINIVNNLQDASDSLISDSPEMMIMDIHIDGFEGKSCLDYPDLFIPVIATSTTVQMKPENYREFGFSGFIKKPLSAKELILLIQRSFEETPQQLKSNDSTPMINPKVTEELLKYNSIDNLFEVHQSFLKEAHEAIISIKSGLLEDDQQKIVDKLHTLRGNSGTLGTERIHDLVSKAQQFARNNHLEATKCMLPDIEKEIEKLEQALINPRIFEI